MRIGTAVIISLLAVVALVAEMVLYVLGVGAAITGAHASGPDLVASVSNLAFIFIGLMILTAAAAVLAPLGAVVELLTKKTNSGSWVLLGGLAIVGVGYVANMTIGRYLLARTVQSTSQSPSTPAPTKETADAAARREYITSSVSIEGVRLSVVTERFGRAVDTVAGTIVNNGTKSLRKVTIRIYFLDDAGKRIGEKEFSPVLFVKDFPIGDNTPLRPNYRKDFDYRLDDAPSGWATRIEWEIAEIDFMEG